MGEDCSWMYNSWDAKRAHSNEWVTKTTSFLDRGFSLSKLNKVWCPCSRYQNMRCLYKRIIVLDLCRHGFVPHYEV
jgi:hypothetical protein